MTHSIKVDFHIHSEYSDGENSFDEIFKLIQANKIKLFSITDHNFISPDIINFSSQIEIENNFFQGIEISTYCPKKKKSLHILGYSKYFDIQKMNYVLQDNINGYNIRAKKIINKLNNTYKGIDLDFESLLKSHRSPFVSRNLLAKKKIDYLKEKKEEKLNIKAALEDVFTKEEEPIWMMSPEKAISLITQSNGLAVLAHPIEIMQIIKERDWLDKLTRIGLKGIEAFYFSYTALEKKSLELFASNNNLFITAGSDWHGILYSPDKNIGTKIKYNLLESFILKISATEKEMRDEKT